MVKAVKIFLSSVKRVTKAFKNYNEEICVFQHVILPKS